MGDYLSSLLQISDITRQMGMTPLADRGHQNALRGPVGSWESLPGECGDALAPVRSQARKVVPIGQIRPGVANLRSNLIA